MDATGIWMGSTEIEEAEVHLDYVHTWGANEEGGMGSPGRSPGKEV